MRQFDEQSCAKNSNRCLTDFARRRRALVGGMAAFGAGLASSVISPTDMMAQPSHAAGDEMPCGRARSLLPKPPPSQKPLQGKSVDSSGTAYTFSKAYPTAPRPPAQDASCLRSNLNRGREFATRCNMAAFVHTWTPRTLIWTGKTWRTPMKTHSCFIAARRQVPGEDCLRLNLWTPEINASHKRPVMVYMHGGGFSGGSGHDLLSYDGESLARNHDVVVVNHNHRLNVYGYLNLDTWRRRICHRPPMLACSTLWLFWSGCATTSHLSGAIRAM